MDHSIHSDDFNFYHQFFILKQYMLNPCLHATQCGRSFTASALGGPIQFPLIIIKTTSSSFQTIFQNFYF